MSLPEYVIGNLLRTGQKKRQANQEILENSRPKTGGAPSEQGFFIWNYKSLTRRTFSQMHSHVAYSRLMKMPCRVKEFREKVGLLNPAPGSRKVDFDTFARKWHKDGGRSRRQDLWASSQFPAGEPFTCLSAKTFT